MTVYFASDFHLKYYENEDDIARRERVIGFIDSIIGKADLLVLLGDIFDLWFAWDNVIIRNYFLFIKKIADLRESGCRIVFIAGNHDFWFNGFLSETIGMEIYYDTFSEVIDGKKILASHGDMHTENDIRYQIFRSVLRSRFTRRCFELLHPDLALRLGNFLSRSSRNRYRPTQIQKQKEQGLRDFARKSLNTHDIVILAHSHMPDIIHYDNGVYVNAGDWLYHDSYVILKNGEIKLKNKEE
jgi:UDP-2,3-diacylglucosamine hydrolase